MTSAQSLGLTLAMALLVTVFVLLPPTALAGLCPPDEESCTSDSCPLPDCNCATENPPGGLDLDSIPQLVVFAIMGPLNGDTWAPLRKLFDNEGEGSKKHLNPNGEPITMTLFVTDNSTDDYCRAGMFYNDGHEIGVTSVNGSDTTMASLSPKEWEAAIMEQKKYLVDEAKIDEEDIRGMRAPDLKTGADRQFKAMEYMGNETKYKDEAWRPYDSSIVIGKDKCLTTTPPLWPYTANYRVFNTINHKNDCPGQCYDGVWEVPVHRFCDNYSEGHDFLDEWVAAENEEMLYYTIVNNFWLHYSTNRAPFIINARTDWFNRDPNAMNAIERFIDVLLNHKDVYIVSMDQMLDWVRHPVPLDKLHESAVFKREKDRSGTQCSLSTLNSDKGLNGTMMLLLEAAILLVLLVVLIAKDKAED